MGILEETYIGLCHSALTGEFFPDDLFGSLCFQDFLFFHSETTVKNILPCTVSRYNPDLHFLNNYISSSFQLINKWAPMKCPHRRHHRHSVELFWLQKFFIQAVGISASAAELIQFHFFFVAEMVSHYPDKWAAMPLLLLLIRLQRGIRFHHLCN